MQRNDKANTKLCQTLKHLCFTNAEYKQRKLQNNQKFPVLRGCDHSMRKLQHQNNLVTSIVYRLLNLVAILK